MTTKAPPAQAPSATPGDYLGEELLFLRDRIVVASTGTQVMMAWEAPLMQRMAQVVSARGGEILEIGFGMGLSATAVQVLGPRSHTVVEAHPQIAERARQWALGRPGVRIIEGRWQDQLDALERYDGILFDVFGGTAQRTAFFSHLGELLRPRGHATYWMGDDLDVGPDMRLVLDAQGFSYGLTRVTAVPTRDCTYSRTNTFRLPVITRRRRLSR